jgi:hypothetical protein
MSANQSPRKFIATLRRVIAVAIPAVALAACATGNGVDLTEGIGFREARFAQISMMREYRACRDQGVDLDRQARNTGSRGKYLTSARVLENCETEIGPDGSGIARDERMRAYALSIQNYFKGGDVEHARENFDKFRQTFPAHDLYYPDGASFTVTMEALLGRKERWTFGEFSALNVNDAVKSEMRRMLYWKNK